jgi:hypothetical protein
VERCWRHQRRAPLPLSPTKRFLAPHSLSRSRLMKHSILFKKRQFHAAAVPSLYTHSLLDHLATFAGTTRAVTQKGTHDIQAAPMPDFWRRVGNLNTVYCTLHRVASNNGYHSSQQLCISSEHPAAGSIELTPSSHRRSSLLDIRSTLHDANYQPLATMLWTGTNDGLAGGITRLETAESEERFEHLRKRSRLFDPATGAVLPQHHELVQSEGVKVTHLRDDLDVGDPAAVTPYIVGSRCIRMKDGGIAALGAFRGATKTTSSSSDAPSDDEGASSPLTRVAVPPWLVLDLVALFVQCAVTSLADVGPAISTSTQKPAQWILASYHHTQDGDLDAAWDRVEVVTGPPKVFPSYTMPPWKHRTGLPMLRGEPCIAWNVELRQGGVLVSCGVYYFTTGVKA